MALFSIIFVDVVTQHLELAKEEQLLEICAVLNKLILT